MTHNSIYQSTLRYERETLAFQSLPLLESSVARRQREELRKRRLAFASGSFLTVLAVTLLAILF